MRTTAALIVLSAALVGMVSLLMRESTQLWHLAAIGTVAGALACSMLWGWRGAIIGLAVGCIFGLVAPVLYIPFWLAFTLPPYPVVDF